MKTSFRKKNKKNRRLFTVFVGILLFFLIVYSGIASPVVRVVVAPFIYVGGVAQRLSEKAGLYVTSDEKILEENRILQEKVSKLELALALNKTNISEVVDDEGVKAKVLVRPSRNLYGTLIVQKESGSTVKKGDIVLSDDGVFIGTVEEAGLAYIKVILSSQPGYSQDVSVERSGTPVTIVGIGGGNMTAELPRGSDIEDFDVLVDLASGRIVAEVGEITADEASAFTTVYARIPANIFEITEVIIIPQKIDL